MRGCCPWRWRGLCPALALCAVLWSAAHGSGGERLGDGPAGTQSARLDARDVLPIFQMRCVACHGKRKQEGGLDLRTQAARLEGGKSGPALVPGKPEESLIVQRVEAGEMPPPELLFDNSVRPPTSAEVQKLREWIAAGAPGAPQRDGAGQGGSEPNLSPEDRHFWAFQPPVRPAVPDVRNRRAVRTPIDAFLLAKLESKGMRFSPDASRVILLRRASLDLIGLPPSPEEVRFFLSDPRPDAYERLVDRLLASPHYGERWGKFWLDAAGYADSEGKVDDDRIRPHAWRYRDYVIRAFNADKPYDQFLTEQLAGDELVDYRGAETVTPEVYEKLVATGFLRMAPDGTYSPPQSFIPERMNVIHDELAVLGSAVLGMTLECCRCHDHKYDPLTQRDYYALSAVLQSAYDPYDWLLPTHRYLDIGLESERREIEQWNAAGEAEIRRLEGEIALLVDPLRKKLRAERLAEIPEVIRDDVAAALETPAEDRNAVQKYLAEKFAAQWEVTDDDLAKRFPEANQQADLLRQGIARKRGKVREMPKIRGLFDMGGEPSAVYVLHRGEALAPREEVQPGVPAVLAGRGTPYHVVRPEGANADTSGRRLALARWLTQPDHPLTARVMVNRIWMHHFGRGLVETPANFGHTGELPTHPDLLDWLATEFVRSGWSIKAMHRLIMTSTAYRQRSARSVALDDATDTIVRRATPPTPPCQGGELVDPDNRLLWRMPLRRMDAEVLYDSILAVTGRLDRTPFGPADPVEVAPAGEVVARPSAPGKWRRSIYVLARRREPLTMLEVFDVPPMSPNCIRRPHSTVATQALQLLNADRLREHARHLAGRLIEQAGEDRTEQIAQAYVRILSRDPTDEEMQQAVADVAALTRHWSAYLAQNGSDADAGRMALGDFCQALISSAEFAYID